MLADRDKDKILKGISRDECAELTKQLCDIPSPTGAEREIGEFILDWYRRHGIKPIRQEIDPNRVNAVGVIEGRGEAPHSRSTAIWTPALPVRKKTGCSAPSLSR